MTQTPSSGGSVTPTSDPQPVTGTASGGATPPKPSVTLEEALARIAELEHAHNNATGELKRHRENAKRLVELEQAEAERQKAQLSEQERYQQEHAELQAANEDLAAALMEANVNQDIARHASKFNFAISPDLIARMLEWSEIDWDEETGKPTNIERMLEKLAKAAPNLIGRAAPTSSGGATNPPRSVSGAFPQITRDNLSEAMAQYDKLAPAQQREVTRLLTGR